MQDFPLGTPDNNSIIPSPPISNPSSSKSLFLNIEYNVYTQFGRMQHSSSKLRTPTLQDIPVTAFLMLKTIGEGSL